MNDQNQNACMACSCPCDMHKEHDHSTQQGDKCDKCGHEHKAGQKCDCGCK